MSDLLPLTDETIWAIVDETLENSLEDQRVNELVWYHLGYRYNSDNRTWDISQAIDDWGEVYPEPPDFIDSRPATLKLTRSIPPENKQLLKQELGFKGYKIGEFGPRQTRRATMANWLLSYRKLQPPIQS
ncbi:MAG: DUF1823 family protein [Roseofilum sp. Belize BBD 4]|uniref:DUF1823 family protein n=1 Tax=Roseofilum sp. Belize BBD 4 TaxID=2821500 RepID=UPI000E99C9ED|nr:DUF1823 family protein [Roseofilum sp. Belize BBD 4]MBP0031747.1 DUF1823 family protein [Roseofilum sp. Belize BBD 4]HBQ98755.1 DUF1823 domain-containing protein [Cyanobacteria bacterium UBA11691]